MVNHHHKVIGQIGPAKVDFAAYSRKYEGRHSNLGYGSFTLCQITSVSDFCKTVRAEFATMEVDAHSNGLHPGLLYSAWPRVWSTHLRLLQEPGPPSYTFSFEDLRRYPNGYGKNTTPPELPGVSSGEARFVVEGSEVLGFGLFLIRKATERGRGSAFVHWQD